MKKFCLLAICLLVVFVAAPLARAQGNAKQGPDVMRDPDLEKDSLHNLEVARHYFKLKKAYIAALQRCEEIIAGNPVFSKIDEVLFMAGESSLRLAENKGKQASKVTSDKLREDARDYLSQLVNGYPDSSFRKQAEEDLKGLGGPKPKESKQSP
jgi:outer membrane protein assembly factor BamD (BamD/ComL family)